MFGCYQIKMTNQINKDFFSFSFLQHKQSFNCGMCLTVYVLSVEVYTLPAWPSSYQLETWWNRFVFDKLKDSYLHLYGFNILRNSIINCWFTRPGFVYAWILGSLRPIEYKSTQEVLADSAQIITDTLFFKY